MCMSCHMQTGNAKSVAPSHPFLQLQHTHITHTHTPHGHRVRVCVVATTPNISEGEHTERHTPFHSKHGVLVFSHFRIEEIGAIFLCALALFVIIACDELNSMLHLLANKTNHIMYDACMHAHITRSFDWYAYAQCNKYIWHTGNNLLYLLPPWIGSSIRSNTLHLPIYFFSAMFLIWVAVWPISYHSILYLFIVNAHIEYRERPPLDTPKPSNNQCWVSFTCNADWFYICSPK